MHKISTFAVSVVLNFIVASSSPLSRGDSTTDVSSQEQHADSYPSTASYTKRNEENLTTIISETSRVNLDIEELVLPNNSNSNVNANSSIAPNYPFFNDGESGLRSSTHGQVVEHSGVNLNINNSEKDVGQTEAKTIDVFAAAPVLETFTEVVAWDIPTINAAEDSQIDPASLTSARLNESYTASAISGEVTAQDTPSEPETSSEVVGRLIEVTSETEVDSETSTQESSTGVSYESVTLGPSGSEDFLPVNLGGGHYFGGGGGFTTEFWKTDFAGYTRQFSVMEINKK